MNQNYLTLGSNSPSSVSHLTIQLPTGSGGDSTDTALTLFTTATANDVAIDGPTADNGKGFYIGAGRVVHERIGQPPRDRARSPPR